MKTMCEYCKFFDPLWTGSKSGLCRKNSPSVLTGEGNSGQAVWPEVDNASWCGEFKKADNEEAES